MNQRGRYVVGACVGLTQVATGLLLWVTAPKSGPRIAALTGDRSTNFVTTAIATTGRWSIFAGLCVACFVLLVWVVRGNRPGDRE